MHLTDAQRWSLIAIASSATGILILWHGFAPPIWCGMRTVFIKDKHGKWVYNELSGDPVQRERLHIRWCPWLWPLKLLTVLLHEVCHAIVGWMTGGTPVFISVDVYQGGLTVFDPNKKQPDPKYTLPAGYSGSCIIGCGLVFAGFDAYASKWAAIVLEVIMLIALITCFLIMPKSAFHHNRHWLRMHLAKMLGRHSRAAEHEKAHYKKAKDQRKKAKWTDPNVPDGYGLTEHDKMVSVDIVLFVDLFVTAVIGVTWWYRDAEYLRYVILAIGMMSALYAICDVAIDGMIHGKDTGSDASEMARVFNEKKPKEEQRSVAHYAIKWFAAMVFCLVAAIVGGLYAFQTTIAEQASRSNEWPKGPSGGSGSNGGTAGSAGSS